MEFMERKGVSAKGIAQRLNCDEPLSGPSRCKYCPSADMMLFVFIGIVQKGRPGEVTKWIATIFLSSPKILTSLFKQEGKVGIE